MSIRPEQPEPYLRGCVFPSVADVPYPRAGPAGAECLPGDVWEAAQLPVGVRLELLGNARTIRVWYRTTSASLGYRGESAGCTFVAYSGGRKVAVADAVVGEGVAELVMSGRPDLPVIVYLPEGMRPLVTGVAGVEDTMVPAPRQPRWLAYGDAVTQGWLASAPAMAWPAVAGRKLGLDVCNFGYAGTATGESTSALMLAESRAEVISVAFGLNNWSRVPHTTSLVSEEVRCFLSVVRMGHPDAPIVVVSPTARPDAEDTPNRVGATLRELRLAMEETVLDCIAEGDRALLLVEGLKAVDPEDLEDGIYPGDEGHRRLAAAVSKVLVPYLADLQTAAEKRWADEGTPLSWPSASPASEAAPADRLLGVEVSIGTPDTVSMTSELPDTEVPDGPAPCDAETVSLAAEADPVPPLAAEADPVPPLAAEADPVPPLAAEADPVPPAPEVKKAVRRDAVPVDIAVADMVVAALSIATNGADDFIVAREPAPTDGFRWAEAAEPAAH